MKDSYTPITRMYLISNNAGPVNSLAFHLFIPRELVTIRGCHSSRQQFLRVAGNYVPIFGMHLKFVGREYSFNFLNPSCFVTYIYRRSTGIISFLFTLLKKKNLLQELYLLIFMVRSGTSVRVGTDSDEECF